MPRRLRAARLNSERQAIVAKDSAISSQLGLRGRRDGFTKIFAAAVVLTVSVALPPGAPADNVMVFGAVKFEPGAPKAQVGGWDAFDGALLTPQVKVTAPAKLFAPVTVIRQEPDWPGVEIVIVELEQPGVTLMPADPTVTVMAGDVALAA